MMIEEIKAVRMRYCGCGMDGWVGGWVSGWMSEEGAVLTNTMAGSARLNLMNHVQHHRPHGRYPTHTHTHPPT